MMRLAALAACAALVVAGGCASGSSSTDAGAHVDAAPLPDAGPRPDGGARADAGIDGGGGEGAAPVVNEFVFNHTGTDSCELIEISGSKSSSYAAYSLLVLEGDASSIGQVEQILPVGTTSGQGLWVTATLPTDSLQNGTSTLLLVKDYSGGADDLDADDDGTLDSEPWSALVDAVAVNDGGADDRTYGGATVLVKDFDGGAIAVGGASRVPDGMDTDAPSDWVRNDFDGDGLDCTPAATATTGEAINTPGAPNTVQL